MKNKQKIFFLIAFLSLCLTGIFIWTVITNTTYSKFITEYHSDVSYGAPFYAVNSDNGIFVINIATMEYYSASHNFSKELIDGNNTDVKSVEYIDGRLYLASTKNSEATICVVDIINNKVINRKTVSLSEIVSYFKYETLDVQLAGNYIVVNKAFKFNVTSLEEEVQQFMKFAKNNNSTEIKRFVWDYEGYIGRNICYRTSYENSKFGYVNIDVQDCNTQQSRLAIKVPSYVIISSEPSYVDNKYIEDHKEYVSHLPVFVKVVYYSEEKVFVLYQASDGSENKDVLVEYDRNANVIKKTEYGKSVLLYLFGRDDEISQLSQEKTYGRVYLKTY
jgi:hypothetical protein